MTLCYHNRMADGGIKQATQELAQTVKAVAGEAVDAVGEMIEQGVQSVVGTQLTPQQIQQQQLEDQKKIAEKRREIEFLKAVDQDQKVVRQKNAQNEADRLKSQQQEEQTEIVQEVQSQQASGKPGLSNEILKSQAEYKVGKGIGG